MRSIFSVIITLFVYQLSFSQAPVPRLIMGEELFENDINAYAYDIDVDSNGYVYFASNGGFMRFDGKRTFTRWKTVDQDKALFYEFIEKGWDDRFLLCSRFGVDYVKEDSILNLPIPDSLIKLTSDGLEAVYFDRFKTLHLAIRNHGYYTIDASGTVKEMTHDSLKHNAFIIIDLPDGKSFHYSIKNKRDTSSSYKVYVSNSENKLSELATINQPSHQSTLLKLNDGTKVFSNGHKDIVHFKKFDLIKHHKFNDLVTKIFADHEDQIWLGTKNSGFYKANINDLKNAVQYWKGSSAVLAQGFDLGLWFKSEVGDIGYIPPNSSPHYSKQNGFPGLGITTALYDAGDQIICLNPQHQLFLVGDTVLHLKPPGASYPSNNDSIVLRPPGSIFFNDKNQTLWVTYPGRIDIWNGKTWRSIKIQSAELRDHRIIRIRSLPDGKIICATEHEIFSLENDQIQIISKARDQDFTIWDFIIDSNKKIWAVSLQKGLWIVSEGKIRQTI